MAPSTSQRAAQASVPCQWCGLNWKVGGIARHEKSCMKRHIAREELSGTGVRKIVEKQMLQRKELQEAFKAAQHPGPGTPLGDHPSSDLSRSDPPETIADVISHNSTRRQAQAESLEPDTDLQGGYSLDELGDGLDELTLQESDNENDNPSEAPQLDDIKIEYHPKSQRKAETYHFEDYNPDRPEILSEDVDQRPWKPFRSQLDFELADLMLACNMNTREKERLLSWIQACLKDPSSFTFQSVRDIDKAWENAKYKATTFEKTSMPVDYKETPVPLTVYTRPIWAWCKSILKNKSLVDQFHWDAERHSKFNGEKFERFIDEPWTGDAWWEMQSSLPEGASPFAIIIYADKTHLSSFGTQKGYPVLARCANLPVELRNGEGEGGSILVGWLPITKEDSKTAQTTSYVNFKRVVWHRAFYEILKSIEQHSKTGCSVLCGDGIIRRIWPFILMVSADYEEQCMMTLIRGAQSYMPCPVCIAPYDCLSDMSQQHPPRTTESMQKLYNEAIAMNITKAEKHLKPYGLRKVENVFWKFANCDIYQATSWDRLHAYHLGLFSDHLQPEMKRILEEINGIHAIARVEDQLNKTPRWSGLNHFTSLKTGEFSDGTKFEDLSKVLLYAAHNVLGLSAEGRCFSKLLRSYLELDMYSSMTVHTETSLSNGNSELIRFSDILKEFIPFSEGNPKQKNWDFPKAHTHIHMFQDILRKGVTRNFNTKVNEKGHGPIKDWYQYQTNFKDVDEQILKFSDMDLVSTLIRTGINRLETWRREKAEVDDAGSPSKVRAVIGSHHASFGSPFPKQLSFEEIEATYPDDGAFSNLRQKFNRMLIAKALVSVSERLQKGALVTPYRLLRVRYESTIDWRECTDLLRVSEEFHHRKRNDYAMVDAGEGKVMFVQLLYLLRVQIPGAEENFALVLPFDFRPDSTASTRRRDSDLHFTRLRARRRTDAIFIGAESIIRGALLSRDYSAQNPDEYIVMDLVSEDMWWRMKTAELSYSTPGSRR